MKCKNCTHQILNGMMIQTLMKHVVMFRKIRRGVYTYVFYVILYNSELYYIALHIMLSIQVRLIYHVKYTSAPYLSC